MKIIKNTLLLLAPLFYFTACQKPVDYSGTYIGLEKITTTNIKGQKTDYQNIENPKAEWYYKCTLTIKGDSAFLQQSPVSVIRKDTLSSVSDGGFYNYKGKIVTNHQTNVTISFIETSCDYCGEIVKKQADGSYKTVVRKKQYEALATPQGLNIQGYLFKKQ